jgi:Mor family transcriptional regulator
MAYKTDFKRNKKIYQDYLKLVVEQKIQKRAFYEKMYEKWDLSLSQIWRIIKREKERTAKEKTQGL